MLPFSRCCAAVAFIFMLLDSSSAFTPPLLTRSTPLRWKHQVTGPNTGFSPGPLKSPLRTNSDDADAEGNPLHSNLSKTDQFLLGVAGTAAALITLYSEYVLKSTGCGLPAGPFGLVGAAEGVSYLGVVGMGGYALYTKVKTGRGLPAGPYGILGTAEGLSFLAISAGLVVLAFQITEYGYIPNAVPVEGGMCK